MRRRNYNPRVSRGSDIRSVANMKDSSPICACALPEGRWRCTPRGRIGPLIRGAGSGADKLAKAREACKTGGRVCKQTRAPTKRSIAYFARARQLVTCLLYFSTLCLRAGRAHLSAAPSDNLRLARRLIRRARSGCQDSRLARAGRREAQDKEHLNTNERKFELSRRGGTGAMQIICVCLRLGARLAPRAFRPPAAGLLPQLGLFRRTGAFG